MQEIVIVDYGMANLRSVQKALENVGYPATITSDPSRVGEADKLILPGVGAFRDAIARLRETRLDEPILDHLRSGKPFFGICLGLQLLFTTSHEDGRHEGLGFFEGEVVRFPEAPGLKVPHMGWNTLRIRKEAPHLRGLPERPSVYFVHSYYAMPSDHEVVAAEADYPEPFAAAVWRDNVFATQFHPEKSQRIGLQMLRQFAEWR
jgi:imidazole glycerol-phosphate synthase subunit HisH